MARGTSVRGGARARLSAIIVCAGAGVIVASVSPSPSPWSAHAETSAFVSLVPARVLETRTGLSTVDGQFNGVGLRDPQSVTALTVAGRAGIAADTKAVVLNVAVTGAAAPGYVTVWPCGVERPNASSLNHSVGQTISNAVTTRVGAGGQICIYTLAATHVVIDVTGAYPTSSRFESLVPGRLLDTRPGMQTIDGELAGAGIRHAGSITELRVRGRAGAGDAGAVVLNVAVTGAAASGFVTVWPCGQSQPNASSLNHDAGRTISNSVTAEVGSNGAVCIFVLSATHVVVDLAGAFPAGAGYSPLVPSRVLETRPGMGTVDGQAAGEGIRSAGSETELLVAGRAGVGAVDAVVLNVAVTGSSAPGFVTVFPCGAARPTASSVNFGSGQTISNAVTAKVGAPGTICIYVTSATHVVVDVVGYFPGSVIGDPASTTTTAPATTSAVALPAPGGSGDEHEYQAVYAYSSGGRPIDADGIELALGQELESVTDWYDRQTGGRHPDFVTDAAGIPAVITTQLTMSSAQVAAHGGYDAAAKQVKALLPAGRYPVVLYDGLSQDGFCGVTSSEGYIFVPLANCNGNGYPKLQGWPAGPTYVLAHELADSLGAVGSCAPHHGTGDHITDDTRDLLYFDVARLDVSNITLDPGRDDYYNPVPGAICNGGNIVNSPLMSP